MQIGLASGGEKGSLQAARNDMGAEMLVMFGFSEGEGEMRLFAVVSRVWWKYLLRMDDVRENTFPVTGLRSELLFSRRLKYCQH